MTADRIPFDADRYFAEPERWGVESRTGFKFEITGQRQDLDYFWEPNGKCKIGGENQDLFMYEIKPAHDPVNNPSHYTQSSLECIDAIRAALTEAEFRGFVKGNAMKYVWREQHKGGAEDLRKAQWYLNKLTESK